MICAGLLFCLALPAQSIPEPSLAPADHAPVLAPGLSAVWSGEGDFPEGSITHERFERFLGRSFKGKVVGQDALKHILQLQVIEAGARSNDLVADKKLLAARIQAARDAATEAGYELEMLVQERGLTMKKFTRLLRNSILHEMIVRKEENIPAGQAVTGAQLQDWTNKVIEPLLQEAKAAPPGMALDNPLFRVTEPEVGNVLRRSLGPTRLHEYLEQLVLQEAMPAWAATAGLTMTDDILEAEINWRRQTVADNPAYAGATYEGLLGTQGATVESVRKSAELRVAAYLRLYSEREYPDAWFAVLSDNMRADFAMKFGPSRLASWFLLRTVDKKMTELDRDATMAAAELEAYKTRALVEGFHTLAGKFSEDDPTRRRNGVMGWIHEIEPGIDPAVCAAAFAGELGSVIGPIPVEGGQALLLVEEERPGLVGDAFKAAVRRSFHKDLRKLFLRKIGFVSKYGTL